MQKRQLAEGPPWLALCHTPPTATHLAQNRVSDRHAYACVLQDGAREGRFSAHAGGTPGEAPDGAKASSDADDSCPCATSSNCVTAISFDKNQRRLVMGTNSGAVTVWNFNNGSLLRRCVPNRAPRVCQPGLPAIKP